MLQAADALPSAGGVAATVVVTMTDEAYRTGRGLAALGHGAVVPTGTALALAGGDLRLLAVAIDRVKGITAYSHTQRLFTETQRLAISARDGGCTFPQCDVPPGWCDTHHIRPYDHGGPTSVDNGTLLCRYHHHHHERLGWTCVPLDGQIHWRPPSWSDPARIPVRNLRHGPPELRHPPDT